jgi:hypothetical protein
MNVQRRFSPFAGMALLFVSASFAQRVKTDYDRNADFGSTRLIPGKRFTPKMGSGSIASKRPSAQRWQRKAGWRWNRAGMFPLWRWK